MILRVVLSLGGLLVVLVAGLVVYAFAVQRPLDTTDPAIFLEDGKTVNYCDLPELDGSGKSADEIPKAYTPGCSFSQTPLPILADCTEPLVEGVVDMRGLIERFHSSILVLSTGFCRGLPLLPRAEATAATKHTLSALKSTLPKKDWA